MAPVERTPEERTEQVELATRLKETREFLGLSQQFVADQTGIPRSAVSDIERGERKVEALELRRFARLYRQPVSYFYGRADDDAVDDETVQALARAATELTADDREEVLRFANYLRHYGGPPGRAGER